MHLEIYYVIYIRAYSWIFLFFNIGRTWFSCKLCNKDLKCGNDGITSLKRHAKTKTHKDFRNAIQIQKDERQDISEITQKAMSANLRARKLEIQISLFLTAKNLPISLSDDLTRFIQNIDVDHNVQKKIRCNRTKCTSIITNVTGKN